MSNALVVKNPEQFLTGALGNFDAYVERVSQIPVLRKRKKSNSPAASARKAIWPAARQLVRFASAFRRAHRPRICRLRACPSAIWSRKAMSALMKAVKRFDPTMNVRLVSFRGALDSRGNP